MDLEILKKIESKSITKDQLLKKIKNNFDLLPEIIKGVSSSKASIRYGCANALKVLSEENPKDLYPYMDFFIGLLDSKYRILKWIGITSLSNLVQVDTQKKFDKIFNKYYGLLNDEYMVTVVNVAGNSGKIINAKPYLSEKITNELLRVEKLKTTPHLTSECKNVIIESTICSFDYCFNEIKDNKKVISFIERQLNNPRKTVIIKAEKFLKKL